MRRCTACGATVVVLGPSRQADADDECRRCGALATIVVDQGSGPGAERLVRRAAREATEAEKERREAVASAVAATAGTNGDPRELAVEWLARAAREGPREGRQVAAQARLLIGRGQYRVPLPGRTKRKGGGMDAARL